MGKALAEIEVKPQGDGNWEGQLVFPDLRGGDGDLATLSCACDAPSYEDAHEAVTAILEALTEGVQLPVR